MRRSHSAPKSERKSNTMNEEGNDRPTGDLFNYDPNDPRRQGDQLMIDAAQMQLLAVPKDFFLNVKVHNP